MNEQQELIGGVPGAAEATVSEQPKFDIDGDLSIPDVKDGDYQNDENDDDDDMEENEGEETIRKKQSVTPKIKSEEIGDPNDKEDEDQEGKDEDVKEEDVNGDRDDEPYIPQSHTIVIPSYAAWFDFKKVHPIEKESLPEFFTGVNPSKTPALYIKYRNFLINAYRLNPNDYLTVTAARRSLVGDVGTIMRLHRLLSRWGLINYQVDAEIKPKPVEPPYTGDYQVSYDAPRGLFPYESFKPPLEPEKLETLKDNLNVKRAGRDDDDIKEEESDIKKPRIVDSINDGWSKEDLKKLLEGLSKYKSDWDAIASHVGTHTVEQCIIRFLKLPIEDKYLGDSKTTLGPLKYAPYLPFSQADNPVLSTIAFLVSLVDADVVRAATERAIRIIDERDLDQETSKEQEEKSPENTLEEGTKVALATTGARAHVFKTNEEIEMNKLTNAIVNTQLNKLELKMSRLEAVEKQLDAEKRILQRQQEDLFLDRLSFAKVSQTAMTKLHKATELQGDALKGVLTEVMELLSKPPRTAISSFDLSNSDASVSETKDEEFDEDSVKPISIETPQIYRYWSG
jgi:SWI/SNF complex subunit SWI3